MVVVKPSHLLVSYLFIQLSECVASFPGTTRTPDASADIKNAGAVLYLGFLCL